MTTALILRRRLITFIPATEENQGWSERVPPPFTSVTAPPPQPSRGCYLLLLHCACSITPQAPNTFELNLKLHRLTVGRPHGETVSLLTRWQTDRQTDRDWVCVCVCAHNLLSQSRKLGSSSKAIQWWKRVRDNAALSNVPHLLPAFTHPPTGFPTHTCKSTPPPPYTLSRGLSCKLDLVLEECGPGERQGKKTHFWTFSSKKTIVSERQTEAPANAREKNSTIAFTI